MEEHNTNILHGHLGRRVPQRTLPRFRLGVCVHRNPRSKFNFAIQDSSFRGITMRHRFRRRLPIPPIPSHVVPKTILNSKIAPATSPIGDGRRNNGCKKFHGAPIAQTHRRFGLTVISLRVSVASSSRDLTIKEQAPTVGTCLFR